MPNWVTESGWVPSKHIMGSAFSAGNAGIMGFVSSVMYCLLKGFPFVFWRPKASLVATLL